jgi:hypothetical protein
MRRRVRVRTCRFSGITAETLAPVKTTLEDVQWHLRQLLPASAILVGHSLENDLRALHVRHPFGLAAPALGDSDADTKGACLRLLYSCTH